MALRSTIFALAGVAVSAQTCQIIVDTTPGTRFNDGGWTLQTCGGAGTGLDACNLADCGSTTGEVFLGDDSLGGSIPDSVGSLSGASFVHLWGNQLTGSIPDTVGNLVAAKGIFLDQNELGGTIPSSFGDLTQLTYLALYDNSLTGTIPAEITQATNLEQLYLDNNQLTGSIPDDIGNLSKLRRFAIWGVGDSQNDLRGSIPASFGSLTDLEYFTISNNDQMSGYPLQKEHCDLIVNRQVACSLTDITFTACDSACADYIQEVHGELNFPSTDGGCGATCERVCDYGDWVWQCSNPDKASCYNTYNPCKNMHCKKVENVNAPAWTADRDYDLVVVKSGTNDVQENIAGGQTVNHYTGGTISHVIKCVEVECFEAVCE